MSAIQQLSGDIPSPEAPLPPDVTWSQVAEIVGSRNAPQCRSKWFFDLAWKEKGGVKPWDFQDDLKLLHLLSSQEVSDEDEVEWVELCDGWDSARSPYHLRNKWACLRRSVPSYHDKTFQGIISIGIVSTSGHISFTIPENLEYLLEYRLPALERKLAITIVKNES